MVVWITGLPSSGKSRLAREVLAELEQRGVPACRLDGDEVRNALGGAFGYSEDERDRFYEALAGLAGLLATQGLVVLVPATAHRRRFRARARELAPAFLEVFVDTPLDACKERDSKGIYAAQSAGRTRDVPGVDAEYEAPPLPDVTAHGGRDPVAKTALVESILRSRTAAAASP
jgi:adenylylsulfate kinase